MRVFLFLFILFYSNCYSDGPWSSGLMPGESYRYNQELGFSEWTNYIHQLNLRAEATDYSSPTNDPKLYIVFPTNIVDTHVVVVGESNFVAQREFIVFTNLVGTSTNNEQGYKTLSIRVDALGRFDEFLVKLLTNYVDKKEIEEAGGTLSWLSETDLQWQWTLTRPELCYCVDYEFNPIPPSTEEDCYSDSDDYFGTDWICPSEAYSWVEKEVKRYEPPTLSISSAWHQLELPIKTNVTILYNYTKNGFGWEFDRLDDYTWSETYDQYRVTNELYGFSVSYSPTTITQSITRVYYEVAESFADNYTLSEGVVGGRKMVVINAEKEFIVTPKSPEVISVLEDWMNYNMSDLSTATSRLKHNYSFTNQTYFMSISDVELTGSYALDSYNVLTNGIENVSEITLSHTGPNEFQLQNGYLIVDEVFVPGGGVFLPTITVTNYFGVDEEYNEAELVQSVFDMLPDWSEGVAYTEIITTIKDYYILKDIEGRRRFPYNQLKSYFTLSELSSTNYLNERKRVMELMGATWGKINGLSYPNRSTVSPTLHYTILAELNDGTWDSFWSVKSRSLWSESSYNAAWNENYNRCDWWNSKIEQGGTTVSYISGGGTTNSSHSSVSYSPECASNGVPDSFGYYEAPWELYWNQQTAPYSFGRSLGMSWYALGSQVGVQEFRRENSESTWWFYSPSIYRSDSTGYRNFENTFSGGRARLEWPKNMSVIITNLSTNLSSTIYQYAIFDNNISTQTEFKITKDRIPNIPAYNPTNLCGSFTQRYTTTVDLALSPLADSPTNWVQYVSPESKSLSSDYVQFGESLYGVNDYPSESWFSFVSGPRITCLDGIGEQEDGKSWYRRTSSYSLDYRVFRYTDGRRNLNTMIFIMDWDFDQEN